MPEFQEGIHESRTNTEAQTEAPIPLNTADLIRENLGLEKRLKAFTSLPVATAIAISALALLEETREVQASEVKPSMSWTEGVEALRHDTLTAENEVGATYVTYKDGTSRWINMIEGEPTEIRSELIAELSILDQQLKDGQVDRICSFHTHTLNTAKEIDAITEEEYRTAQAQGYNTKVSVPPSSTDVSIVQRFTIETLLGDYGFNAQENYIKAVADPAGIWYGRGSRDEDYDKINRELRDSGKTEIVPFEDARQTYMRESLTGQVSEEAYKDLQIAYMNEFNTVVRFTPYENIKNEPPCTGVDLKANK